MTPHRIDEIERRLKAATPGEWRYDTYNHIYAEQGKEHVCSIPDHPADGLFLPEQSQERGAWYRESEANARLIAHAPTDIAYLLDELRKARSPAHDDAATAEIRGRRKMAWCDSAVDRDLWRVRHAAEDIDTLLSALTSAHREIAELNEKVEKACALADVFQKQFLEHTAHVKAFLLQLSEISGPLFDPSDKVTVEEMCAALIASAEQQRQWAHDKTAELTTAHRERDEMRSRAKSAEFALAHWDEGLTSEHWERYPEALSAPIATEGGG
jgi:hypothetical protein